MKQTKKTEKKQSKKSLQNEINENDDFLDDNGTEEEDFDTEDGMRLIP